MIKKKIFIATAVFASICMLGGCATSKSSKKAAEATTEAAQQAKATPVKLNASEYVKLGQYKGLTIKGASTKVTDQDVQHQSPVRRQQRQLQKPRSRRRLHQ